LPEVALEADELSVLRRAAERVAQLADTPLGGAARSALRKLSFDLPEAGVGEEERGLVEPTPPAFDKQFAVLRGAVEQRRAVRCRYYAIGRDKEEERVIEPYGLMLSWGHWYCVGRSRERAAMRVFRVDRMKDVTLVEGKERDFQVRSVDAFVRWLLPLGRQVEVLSPASIRDRLEGTRKELRALYR